MTGFTNILIEKNLSFPEFAMLCARGMGMLIEMRDASLDAVIPDRFEPNTYHRDRLEEARTKVASMYEMRTEQARRQFGTRQIRSEIDMFRARINEIKANATNAKLKDMKKSIDAWVPPTVDHVSLKKFMFDQIDLSIDKKDPERIYFDWIERLEAWDALAWFNDKLRRAEDDVRNHSKEWDDEVERTKQRNEWIKVLRESLK